MIVLGITGTHATAAVLKDGRIIAALESASAPQGRRGYPRRDRRPPPRAGDHPAAIDVVLAGVRWRPRVAEPGVNEAT
jgi:hypothetical protein